MKLMRAPVWQRLLVAKLSPKKAMVALRLEVTQDRDMENMVGRTTPEAGGQTQCDQAAAPSFPSQPCPHTSPYPPQ